MIAWSDEAGNIITIRKKFKVSLFSEDMYLENPGKLTVKQLELIRQFMQWGRQI